MQKMRLLPNAKDINGRTLPLHFFENKVIIIEKKQRTLVVGCKGYKLEVYPEVIKEYL